MKMLIFILFLVFFFFKQKTAYEISECDWSSDVCSSDLEQDLQNLPVAARPVSIVFQQHNLFPHLRSEERRVVKACRIGCRSRWSPYHEKKKEPDDNKHFKRHGHDKEDKGTKTD